MHRRDRWVDDSPALHLGALYTLTRSQNIAADERPHRVFQNLCSQAEFSENSGGSGGGKGHRLE